MNKETLRMQLLSGVITESEYKAKLTENKPSSKETLKENFVGMGMVGNIFDREKTDYELAFEHFTKGTSLNEDIYEEELEEIILTCKNSTQVVKAVQEIISEDNKAERLTIIKALAPS